MQDTDSNATRCLIEAMTARCMDRHAPSQARLAIDSVLEYEVDATSEFVFLIHVAEMQGQTLIDESLLVEPQIPYACYTDAANGNRFLRLQAEAGTFKVVYRAIVDRHVEAMAPDTQEVVVHDIPTDVLHYVTPTHYCESDALSAQAQALFGAMPPGLRRVQAISDWVQNNITYCLGSINVKTSAADVFARRTGVCRDFAHLSIAFCKALNIPARMVSGYALFSASPPDFHAVFEAFVGGHWVMFDPTGMAPVEHVVRIATGRDAKDVAFATIFGPARMKSMFPDTMLLGDMQAPSPDHSSAHKAELSRAWR
jgi:transglutaminase-like putative cysteine protease